MLLMMNKSFHDFIFQRLAQKYSKLTDMKMRSCPDRDAVIGYLLVLVLVVTWLSFTGLKVLEFLSEPTATKTLWQRKNFMPPFTICPALRTTSLSEGGDPDRENDTLMELFRDLSLSPEDMLLDLETPEDNSSEFVSCNDYGCVDFKTSVDYNIGGTCLTSKAKSLDLRQLVLQPNPLYEHELENPLTYDLVFHGHPDFVGDRFVEDPTYYLSAAQRGVAITVTTDRRIEVNLRRDPCADDPNYSKRLCERQCFFDWLNCSMHGDHDTNKPRCMASDAEWYEEAEPFSAFYDAPDGAEACTCPKPCVTDFISISVQPDFFIEDDNFTYVQVMPARTMKVLKTYVTYTFSDLMADTGGFLGLFLGSSILSMCHLLPKPVKWFCDKCGGQDKVTTAHWKSREARKTQLSPYPVPPYSEHRGDTVIRISLRPDRLTY